MYVTARGLLVPVVHATQVPAALRMTGRVVRHMLAPVARVLAVQVAHATMVLVALHTVGREARYIAVQVDLHMMVPEVLRIQAQEGHVSQGLGEPAIQDLEARAKTALQCVDDT